MYSSSPLSGLEEAWPSPGSGVQTQIDVLGASERACILCKRNQHVRDIRSRCIRTVFGRIEVTCRRYIEWGVEKGGQRQSGVYCWRSVLG